MLSLIESTDAKRLMLALVDDFQPNSPFERHPLITPTMTIGNQLVNEIARHKGVVLGLEPQLWSMLEWQLIEDAQPRHAKPHSEFAPLSTAAIHWKIFCHLQQHLADQSALQDAHPLTPLLHPLLQNKDLPADELSRRLWSLSQQLASYQSAYLHQRPDWLKQWQQGFPPLSALMKHYPPQDYPSWLQEEDQHSYRAQHYLYQTLLQADHQARQQQEAIFWEAVRHHRHPNLPAHLWVYLLDQISPRMLDFLHKLGQQSACHVHLYHHIASEHYIADLVDAKWLQQRRATPNPSPEPDHYDSGNTLFSRFGKLKRATARALQQYELYPTQTLAPKALCQTPSLLQTVQNAIARLDNNLNAANVFDPNQPDDSLQIHACHGLLRQLEVLRHEIVKWLNRDPERRLSDVLLLAPNLNAIAPSLHAVFPPSGNHDGYSLPARITGIISSNDDNLWHSLRGQFILDQTLDLPTFASWLQLSETCAALGLSHEQSERAIVLLQQAGFRRALDESALRQTLDANDHDTRHCFTHALDRLLAGMLMPEASELAPCDNLTLNDRTIIKALCQLANQWLNYRHERPTRHARDWLSLMRQTLAEQYADYSNQAGYAHLDHILRDLHYTLNNPFTPLHQHLSLPFLLDYVAQQLAQKNTGGEPSGAITIGQLNALRAMPYKLIVFFNADQSAFPSQQQEERHLLLNLDHARHLDYHRQHNEMNAFFSTLQNATQSAWYFYSHTDPQHSEEQAPCFPVQELLQYLREQRPDLEAQYFIHHPADPLDDPDAAPLWHDLHHQTPRSADRRIPWGNLLNLNESLPEFSPSQPLALKRIAQQLQRPAQSFLRANAIAYFQDEPSALEAREPLECSALALTRLRQKLLHAIQTQQPFQPRQHPDLPAGIIGETILAQEQSALQERLNTFLHQHQHSQITPCREQEITLPFATLRAELPMLPCSQWLQLSASRDSIRHRLGYWLHHLLWQASGHGGETMISFEGGQTWHLAPCDKTWAQAELHRYLALWHANQSSYQSSYQSAYQSANHSAHHDTHHAPFFPIFWELILHDETTRRHAIQDWLNEVLLDDDEHFGNQSRCYPIDDRQAIALLLDEQNPNTLQETLEQHSQHYAQYFDLRPFRS